jgi:EF-hand domain-containing family member B
MIRQQKHGVPTPVYADGRHTRDALIWSRSNHCTPVVSQGVSAFDEYRSDNAGVRTRRFLEQTGLPIDHRFGVPTGSDRLSAGEIIHQRTNNSGTFDDKSQAAIAKLRAHLCSIHMTTFRTQLQAFQYYDTNHDGFISIQELTHTIEKNFNLQLSDGIIAALVLQCDQDHDGKLSFLEFSNFLCYRTAHASGLDQLVNDEKKRNQRTQLAGIIHDQQGRPLINVADLVDGANGKYYPRRLISQIDEMVPDGWKTSYDKINEAPFRLEPVMKRRYGVPSINLNEQYAIPTQSSHKQRSPLGANTIVGALLSPSIWNDRGLNDDDLLSPKTMEEIRDLYANANVYVSSDDFVYAWTTAAATNQHGHVSVASFKQALDDKNRSLGNINIVYK